MAVALDLATPCSRLGAGGGDRGGGHGQRRLRDVQRRWDEDVRPRGEGRRGEDRTTADPQRSDTQRSWPELSAPRARGADRSPEPAAKLGDSAAHYRVAGRGGAVAAGGQAAAAWLADRLAGACSNAMDGNRIAAATWHDPRGLAVESGAGGGARGGLRRGGSAVLAGRVVVDVGADPAAVVAAGRP